MPSEDAKAVKKEDTCENSLRSPLESRKKKPVNANAKPKVVKKEEVKDEDGDFDKPIKRVAAAGAKESRVKKEPNDVLDDDKPISKNNSTTTTNAAKADTRVIYIYIFYKMMF